MIRFLWGAAVGCFGLLLAEECIPFRVPARCPHERAAENLRLELWKTQNRLADARFAADLLAWQLAQQAGPFGVPGLAVGDDIDRRERTRVPRLGDAPEDLIPPAGVPEMP